MQQLRRINVKEAMVAASTILNSLVASESA